MNKTVLITVASSGIGYELTKIFSKNGYNLVLVSKQRQELEATAKEMEDQYDIHVKAIPKDLSNPSAPQELYDEIVAGGRRDALVLALVSCYAHSALLTEYFLSRS